MGFSKVLRKVLNSKKSGDIGGSGQLKKIAESTKSSVKTNLGLARMAGKKKKPTMTSADLKTNKKKGDAPLYMA